MNKRTALVFGATGLIGNLLLEELIKSVEYKEIMIFVRQPSGISYPNVTEFIIDFDSVEKYAEQIKGEDLFICLGTTIKKAGSVKRMEEIDRDLPVKIATYASANGIKRVAVVSSLGASASSKNYYLRIKGEMEAGILNVNFENTAIVRPSMVLGERKEKRTGETMGKIVMKTFKPLLTGKFRKYRAIHGKDVARAMIALLQKEPIKNIYESDELQKIADLYQ
jgi:uncharacterized protein YbjT (DUF2867 family)